jgi:hypothetical protein
MPGRAVLRGTGLCLLLLLPYLLIRPTQQHAFWLGMWEGLGDLGGDRGYSWFDGQAKERLARAGLAPFESPQALTQEHERFFKGLFLRSIREDRLWYTSVLARRALATMTQSKLMPMRIRDGYAVERPLLHYKYTLPADFFIWGSRRVELPLPLLWLPAILSGLLLAFARWRGDSEPKRQLGGFVALGACAGLGAITLPVLVTTAGGIETQGFVVVYFLGFAALAQELARQLRRIGTGTEGSRAFALQR